jgi:hypothetical protein
MPIAFEMSWFSTNKNTSSDPQTQKSLAAAFRNGVIAATAVCMLTDCAYKFVSDVHHVGQGPSATAQCPANPK